jgi:hypothetical protein
MRIDGRGAGPAAGALHTEVGVRVTPAARPRPGGPGRGRCRRQRVPAGRARSPAPRALSAAPARAAPGSGPGSPRRSGSPGRSKRDGSGRGGWLAVRRTGSSIRSWFQNSASTPPGSIASRARAHRTAGSIQCQVSAAKSRSNRPAAWSSNVEHTTRTLVASRVLRARTSAIAGSGSIAVQISGSQKGRPLCGAVGPEMLSPAGMSQRYPPLRRRVVVQLLSERGRSAAACPATSRWLSRRACANQAVSSWSRLESAPPTVDSTSSM